MCFMILQKEGLNSNIRILFYFSVFQGLIGIVIQQKTLTSRVFDVFDNLKF